MTHSYTSSRHAKPITTKDHYRIFLVDDEPDVLFIFKRGLEVNGFVVDAYHSPQEAI